MRRERYIPSADGKIPSGHESNEMQHGDCGGKDAGDEGEDGKAVVWAEPEQDQR
jgi:hypothetical protein